MYNPQHSTQPRQSRIQLTRDDFSFLAMKDDAIVNRGFTTTTTHTVDLALFRKGSTSTGTKTTASSCFNSRAVTPVRANTSPQKKKSSSFQPESIHSRNQTGSPRWVSHTGSIESQEEEEEKEEEYQANTPNQSLLSKHGCISPNFCSVFLLFLALVTLVLVVLAKWLSRHPNQTVYKNCQTQKDCVYSNRDFVYTIEVLALGLIVVLLIGSACYFCGSLDVYKCTSTSNRWRRKLTDTTCTNNKDLECQLATNSSGEESVGDPEKE